MRRARVGIPAWTPLGVQVAVVGRRLRKQAPGHPRPLVLGLARLKVLRKRTPTQMAIPLAGLDLDSWSLQPKRVVESGCISQATRRIYRSGP